MRQLTKLPQLLLLICTILLTSACANLANLREILNTVSYQDQPIAYELDQTRTRTEFKVGSNAGQFRLVSAQLGFAQPHIHQGQLAVTVATGSIDLANPLVEEMLRGGAWFDSKRHPLASFVTTQLIPKPPDSLTARGELTIKDIKQPLDLQVHFADGLPDLSKNPQHIAFTAQGSFSRASYDMTGLTEFAPDEVQLTVSGWFSHSTMAIDSSSHIAKQ